MRRCRRKTVKRLLLAVAEGREVSVGSSIDTSAGDAASPAVVLSRVPPRTRSLMPCYTRAFLWAARRVPELLVKFKTVFSLLQVMSQMAEPYACVSWAGLRMCSSSCKCNVPLRTTIRLVCRIRYPPFMNGALRFLSTLTMADIDITKMTPMSCLPLPVVSFNAVHRTFISTSSALAVLILLLTLSFLKRSSEQRRRKKGKATQTDIITSGHLKTVAL